MKKLLIILGIVFSLLLIAIITVPIIFKDDIQAAIDEAVADSVDAEVFYDTDNFSLSLIKNFPNFTVSIGDFGVAGVEEFEGDTLVSVGSFQITVDLMSVISGDQIQIREVLLEEPRITVLVLEDGKANYDIAKAEETPAEQSNETPTPDTSPEEDQPVSEGGSDGDDAIQIGVQKWEIRNGQLIYLDLSTGMTASLLGLNHEGSGDFTLEVFDLTTTTSITSVNFGFEGEEYVHDKTLSADLNLNMDLSQMKFTFLDNRVALNDFAFEIDGSVDMPSDDIAMDITFGGKDISLKGILSLIPGAYQGYLDGVTASGSIGFDGYVKGVFNETSMPQVVAQLGIENGSILYSDYPVPIENLVLKTSFNYPSADLRETTFNVDRFSMLVDGEELSSYLKVKNLENLTWDFGFDGNADLEKITKIVPMEGMELKGKINANLKSAGQMADVEAERFGNLPTSGNMTIKGFSFQSADLPQGFGIASSVLSFDPKEIRLSEFDANLGKSDLSLKGRLTNYLGFALNNELLVGNLDFNSKLLDLNEFMTEEDSGSEESTSGADEVAAEASNEGEEKIASSDSSSVAEPIIIPPNIDFTLSSNIERVAMMEVTIDNFKGQVLVKDGAVILDENTFQMLDGTFELTGSYRTKDLEKPEYDFSFNIKDLSIASAFSSFSMIRSYVPIAEQVTGKFSTDMSVDGTLGPDMMPILDELNMAGLVNVAQASLQGGDFMNKVSAVASLKGGGSGGGSKSLNLKDVLISTSIKNGTLFVEPFDLEVNGQKATLGGSNTLDGKLNYAMLVKDIPTGAVGDALNSALSSLTGGNNLVSDKIDLNLGIGGTTDDPSVKLLGSSPSSSSSGSTGVKAAFKDQVSSKVDEEKAKAEEELAKRKAEAEAKAKAAADSAKKAAEAKKKAAEAAAKKKLEEEKKKLEEAAKNKVKDLFKKKGGGR